MNKVTIAELGKEFMSNATAGIVGAVAVTALGMDIAFSAASEFKKRFFKADPKTPLGQQPENSGTSFIVRLMGPQ